MVVLNRIYTRTGDDGTTALGTGERRPKYDLRVSAYGTVDETNAAIGVVRLHLKDARDLDRMLGLIQNDLFDLGADLAVPQRDGKAERLRMLSSQVERLERDIDTLNAHLADLTSFVLPGGTPRSGIPAPRPHHMSQGGTNDGGTRRQAGRALSARLPYIT
jgi:cob(I)alamin adenosyltransferase